MKLGELAIIVRSKNAGIGHVTVDVVFDDARAYAAAKGALDAERIAKAYGVPLERITDYVEFDEGLALKVTFRRERIAGADGLGETDVYGSSQYAPMLELEIGEGDDTSHHA